MIHMQVRGAACREARMQCNPFRLGVAMKEASEELSSRIAMIW